MHSTMIISILLIIFAYIIGWMSGYSKGTKENKLYRDWFIDKYDDN